jgi:hypothetical protein
MTQLMEKSSGFARDLGDAARENPLSAALIGMGVLWMFGGGAAGLARRVGVDRVDVSGTAWDAARSMRNAGSAVGESMRNAAHSVRDAGTAVGNSVATSMQNASAALGESVSSTGRKMQGGAAATLDQATRFGQGQRETVAEYARSVPEYARSLPESGGQMVQTLRSNLADLFRAQPLALGAIGLAIGAGIAAAVPSTKMEAEYFGETSDAAQEKAKQFVTEQTSRAKDAAEKAFNAATEEAERQGLTLQGAKSAAGQVSDKVSRVAQAAAGASERPEPDLG